MLLANPIFAAFLKCVPANVVQIFADLIVLHLKRRHGSLFKNLAALPKSKILIEVSDLSLSMLFSFGNKQDTTIDIISPKESIKYNTKIKGDLETLLKMLEGKTDGDEEFFSRSIQIFGNTNSIVAFRNVLDRESISLYGEINDIFGEFTPFVLLALNFAENFFDKISPLIVSEWNSLNENKKTGTRLPRRNSGSSKRSSRRWS